MPPRASTEPDRPLMQALREAVAKGVLPEDLFQWFLRTDGKKTTQDAAAAAAAVFDMLIAHDPTLRTRVGYGAMPPSLMIATLSVWPASIGFELVARCRGEEGQVPIGESVPQEASPAGVTPEELSTAKPPQAAPINALPSTDALAETLHDQMMIDMLSPQEAPPAGATPGVLGAAGPHKAMSQKKKKKKNRKRRIQLMSMAGGVGGTLVECPPELAERMRRMVAHSPREQNPQDLLIVRALLDTVHRRRWDDADVGMSSGEATTSMSTMHKC